VREQPSIVQPRPIVRAQPRRCCWWRWRHKRGSPNRLTKSWASRSISPWKRVA